MNLQVKTYPIMKNDAKHCFLYVSIFFIIFQLHFHNVKEKEQSIIRHLNDFSCIFYSEYF